MGRWWGCRLFSGAQQISHIFAPQITFFFSFATESLHLQPPFISLWDTSHRSLSLFRNFLLGDKSYHIKVSQRLISFGGNTACQLRAIFYYLLLALSPVGCQSYSLLLASADLPAYRLISPSIANPFSIATTSLLPHLILRYPS